MNVFLPLSKVVQSFINITQFHHGGIGNYESAGNAGHCFQILNGSSFKIDFGGDFEPLHVNSPLGYAFFVDQVDGGYIGGC